MDEHNDLLRREDENYYQYLWRVSELIDMGKYDSWQQIASEINKALFGDNADLWRDESAFRKPVQYTKKFYDAGVFTNRQVESAGKYEKEKRELLKLKSQIQSEKAEYNRWLREEARDELIKEHIVDAIRDLPPLECPVVDNRIFDLEDRAGVLLFGDEHFGTEFEIKGLNGEILNAYSPEIFEDRMERLLAETVRIIEKEELFQLYVFGLGDFLDGILRVSQLRKLRYGLVESVVMYSDYLTGWLNRLSEHVHITYQLATGNHTELRMLGQKKGTFAEENLDIVLKSMLQTRLENNANFELKENPSGYIYDEVLGYKVLAIHGEVKDLSKAIKEYSQIYGAKINYLYAGHLHHHREEVVGVDTETINVPSIIGVDGFSMQLRKTSNAGALLDIFEKGKGRYITYNIKLN